MKLLSRVRLFATPKTVAYQAPPSMGFSREEYWSGLPFPSPGDLPEPGIEPGSPAFQADGLTSEPPGKPVVLNYESYWIIATSFPNKIWCWNINYWTLASFYRETKGLNFPGSLAGKESACSEGDPSSIPGLRRSPGEEKRLPTPVFWPGEFNGLYSPRGLRVRHDWSTFTFTFQRTVRLSTHSDVFRTGNEYVWCYSAMFSTRKQMFFLEIITDIYVHWSSEC